MANAILQKLQGLLGNPSVQGLAGAAAFGANPLVGLLAGQLLKGNRDNRAVENEKARRSLRAQERLPGLLAQDINMPQRKASPVDPVTGRRRMIPGLLDVDPGDDVSGTEAFDPGVVGRTSVPLVSTRAGNAELQGLMADMEPQTFVQGQLANQASPTAFDQRWGLFRQMFPDGVPNNPSPTEKAVLQFIGAADENSSLETLRLGADLARINLELENTRDERTITQLDHQRERVEFGNNLNKSADALFEMADINSQLAEGSAITAPGFGAKGRSTVASALSFGAGALGAREFSEEMGSGSDLTARFDDLSNSLALDRLAVEDFDAGTNQRFQAFINTKPQVGRGQRPTDLRIADNLEALLLAHQARPQNGFTPERVGLIEQRIKDLREGTLPPSALLQMSLQDILSLDAEETDSYTDQQKAALEMRMGQLGL